FRPRSRRRRRSAGGALACRNDGDASKRRRRSDSDDPGRRWYHRAEAVQQMTHASRLIGVVAAALVALTVSIHPQAPAAPGAATLRIVVLETEDAARRVREELVRGGNFVAIATARSVDPSKADGGMLGRVSLSSLRPELRKAVEGLPIGGLSPLVPIPTGFAIVQVIADREAAHDESPSGA